MNVLTTVVGQHSRDPEIPHPVPWPDGWPIPREGEEVTVGEVSLFVRTIVWIVSPDSGSDVFNGEPYVYLVLGEPHR